MNAKTISISHSCTLSLIRCTVSVTVFSIDTCNRFYCEYCCHMWFIVTRLTEGDVSESACIEVSAVTATTYKELSTLSVSVNAEMSIAISL